MIDSTDNLDVFLVLVADTKAALGIEATSTFPFFCPSLTSTRPFKSLPQKYVENGSLPMQVDDVWVKSLCQG